MNIKSIATDNFNNGYNCAQAVISGFVDKHGLNSEEAFRLADGLGGGLKGGYACGAAVGGVIVIGYVFGAKSLDENVGDSVSAEKTKMFIEAFQQSVGGIDCSEILGKTPQQRTELTEEEKAEDRKFCMGVVEKAVEILLSIGC